MVYFYFPDNQWLWLGLFHFLARIFVEIHLFLFSVSHKYMILAKGDIQLDPAILFIEKRRRPSVPECGSACANHSLNMAFFCVFGKGGTVELLWLLWWPVIWSIVLSLSISLDWNCIWILSHLWLTTYSSLWRFSSSACNLLSWCCCSCNCIYKNV